MTGRRDLSNWFLAVLGAGLILGFVVYALPSLLSIYRGTYREMALPDGSRVVFAPEIKGAISLATRHGETIEVSGYAYDRRRPDFPLEIVVFFHNASIGSGVTDQERADVSRDQNLNIRAPGFLVQVPGDRIPQDTKDPIRIFAVTPDSQASELFKGARRVGVVDDTAPKTAK